jgi:tetratricopeptide (TPR) repeat protein
MMARLRATPTTENAVALGDWFASNKRFDCAIETFREAEKTDPQSAQLHYLEGLAFAGSGRPTAAIPPLQNAIRLQPDVIPPHLLLATLYEQSGLHDQADEQWKQALAVDPQSEPALEGLSGALLARKDFIDVIGLLHHAPRTEPLALRLAAALEALNYLDGANDVLVEAMKLAPDSLPLANAEAAILIRKWSYLETVKLLGYMTTLHPDDRGAELQFLRILVLTQHNDLARPIGLKLLAQTPHDPEVLYLNGVLDYAVGNYADAKAHLEEAVSQVPDFFHSRYYLGVVLVHYREWEEAREHLEKAIALGDTEPKVYYELGMALHGLGENDKANDEINRYQDLRQAEEDEIEANAQASQGDEELAGGRIEEAIGHYREACDKLPEKAGFKYKLAVALHKSGDTDGERKQLEEAVKLDPQLARAQRQLGYLLARSGDAAGAVEHFQMAVRAAPAWTEAWINLAAELAIESKFTEAREAVAMALRLDPGDAKAQRLNDRLARDPGGQHADQ